MFTQFFPILAAAAPEASGSRRRFSVASLWQSYDDWRFERDVAAVMSAFDRLTDRQLHMIGLSRDDLYETVEEMMLDAEEQRAVGQEVIALLEAPSEASRASLPADRAEPDTAKAARDLRAA